MATLPRWTVVATLTPTRYNQGTPYTVEAETDRDAALLVRRHLNDFRPSAVHPGIVLAAYDYTVTPWKPLPAPPPGRIL